LFPVTSPWSRRLVHGRSAEAAEQAAVAATVSTRCVAGKVSLVVTARYDERACG
jgi:hypothetical protein